MNFAFIHAACDLAKDPFPYIKAFEVTGLGEMSLVEYRGGTDFLERLKRTEPEVIFFGGPYDDDAPSDETFSSMRRIAPLVNISMDAADPTWEYVTWAKSRNDWKDWFDLNVSIDGVVGAATDYATLTPVDVRMYREQFKRGIRCGFSGVTSHVPVETSKGKAQHPRTVLLEGLAASVKAQNHSLDRSASEYANFMMRCQIAINTSWTQSPRRTYIAKRHISGWLGRQCTGAFFDIHHIKGRVLDAGWAGCCLLESAGSPIGDWFPADSYYIYHDLEEATHLINTLTDNDIGAAAEKLHAHAVAHYHPKEIYGSILRRVH